ncbi:hypothetical protein ACIGHB_30000 [Streptomyces sp. NPDC085460]|uniref:hypothetical protein n=1 Tax=Streptomyces sp. NPDC085460 TaxID=3365723 RepID=UPI0037D12014
MSPTPSRPASRVGRNYTKARTHPWVLGKLGDFVLWFGPYNAGQLVIAAIGVMVLIKTFHWWSGLGPIPVLALGVLVWAARAQRIGGRAPMWVLHGLARRALQPKTGRIGGRTARPPRPRHLAGTVLIEHTSATAEPAGPTPKPAGRHETLRHPAPHRPAASARRRGPSAPASPLAPDPVPGPAVRTSGGRGPAPTPWQQMLHDRSKAKAAAR